MLATYFRTHSSLVWPAFLLLAVACVPACSRQPEATPMPMTGTSQALPPTDPSASEILRILKKRRTTREFSPKPLDRKLLANLLWAGNGINRAGGGRTSPAGHGVYTVDIYVSDATGVFTYDAHAHALTTVQTGDIRALTGLQDYAAKAPVNLVFVHDERTFGSQFTPEERTLFSITSAAAIMENIYLFCAANDLNVGARSDIDRPALAKALGLAPEQKILLAQSIGYAPTMQAIKDSVKNFLGRD